MANNLDSLDFTAMFGRHSGLQDPARIKLFNMFENATALFGGAFSYPLIDASLKFESKKKKYGDSWKSMTFKQLKDRLLGEVKELVRAKSDKEVQEEAIDVVNVALMIAERARSADVEKIKCFRCCP